MDEYTLSTVIPSLFGVALMIGAMTWGTIKVIKLVKEDTNTD